MPHAPEQTVEQKLACLNGQRWVAQISMVELMQGSPINYSSVIILAEYIIELDVQINALDGG